MAPNLRPPTMIMTNSASTGSGPNVAWLDHAPGIANDPHRCNELVALMIIRRDGFRKSHVVAAHVGGLGVPQSFPGLDHPLPRQVARGLLEHLREDVGRAIADEVVDIGPALRQLAVSLGHQTAVVRDRRFVLGREERRVVVAPDVFVFSWAMMGMIALFVPEPSRT